VAYVHVSNREIEDRSYARLKSKLPVMLNEAKTSRPRPKLRGRGQGQSYEAEAKARNMRSRPKPRPKLIMKNVPN